MFDVGVVKVIDVQKGFGFITPQKGRELFFHAAGCGVSLIALNPGDRVKYRIEGEGRKRRAVQVELVQ